MFYRKSRDWTQSFDLLLLSLVALHCSWIISYCIHIDFDYVYCNTKYLNLSIISSLLTVLFSILFRIFNEYKHQTVIHNLWQNLKLVALVDIALMFYILGTQQGIDYSRIILFIYFPILYFIFSCIFIDGYKYIFKYLFKNKNEYKTLLLVTTEHEFREIVNNLAHDYKVVGVFIIDREKSSNIAINEFSTTQLVTIDNYKEFANKQWIDEVLVITDSLSKELSNVLEELALCGSTVHFALSNSFYKTNQLKQFASTIGTYRVITSTLNYMSYSQFFLKRLMDVVGALVGCLLTIVLMCIIGPVIYFLSPGPIFFKQKRVGIHGKEFQLYKFRTMYLDAEAKKKELEALNLVKDGLMFKMKFDPRIIGNKQLPNGETKEGFGAFLRKYSLDEFPQFFNVLKGDMSLVGTRPPTIDEWNKYKLYQKSRLFIKPGITGLWQVSGRSTITEFKDVIALDRKYILEWSLWSDVLILLKTIKIVILHKGSY